MMKRGSWTNKLDLILWCTRCILICHKYFINCFMTLFCLCPHGTGFASHFEVCSSLQLLDDNQVLSVGGALGLAFNVLRRMKVLPDEMVAAWLRREDYVSEEPTWRALLKALRRVGQSGLAQDIENNKR